MTSTWYYLAAAYLAGVAVMVGVVTMTVGRLGRRARVVRSLAVALAWPLVAVFFALALPVDAVRMWVIDPIRARMEDRAASRRRSTFVELCDACIELRVSRASLLAAAELYAKGTLTSAAVTVEAVNYADQKRRWRERDGRCCDGSLA